jgi:hypothetical protein
MGRRGVNGMFYTATEVRGMVAMLDPNQHYEITHNIEERRTGRRAAVTLVGKPAQLNEQVQAVYNDGWGIAERIGFCWRS